MIVTGGFCHDLHARGLGTSLPAATPHNGRNSTPRRHRCRRAGKPQTHLFEYLGLADWGYGGRSKSIGGSLAEAFDSLCAADVMGEVRLPLVLAWH